jgi:hypothetical protein
MNREVFTSLIKQWIQEMHQVASALPGTGACAIGSALDLWLWTYLHVTDSAGNDGPPCGPDDLAALADGLSGLLSARAMVLAAQRQASPDEERTERADSTGAWPNMGFSMEGFEPFYSDMCHHQSAKAAGKAGQICAELVFGRRLHPTWDRSCNSCIQAEEIDALEGIMPGISYGARLTEDVLETDGSHPEKAGPCARLGDFDGFIKRRNKLDGCLSGSWLAKQRAAQALLEMATGTEAEQ